MRRLAMRMQGRGAAYMAVLEAAISIAGVIGEASAGKGDVKPLEGFPGASITIFPVALGGNPSRDVADVVGLMLEKDGYDAFDMTDGAFRVPSGTAADGKAAAFGAFVKGLELKTDYALYAEFAGTPGKGVDEVYAAIVDAAGNVAWEDRQRPGDAHFDRVKPRNPMTCCVLLHERLRMGLSLDGLPKKPGTEGKMEKLWREKSGLPDKAELAAMKKRLKAMKKTRSSARLLVYPPRLGDRVDQACATRLTGLVNDAGLWKATAAEAGPVLEVAPSSNEQRMLWDFARAAKQYVEAHPPDTDYALFADYIVRPRDEAVLAVHFVVCDRTGAWVAVDLQNEHQKDFKRIKPKTAADCDRLVSRRLKTLVK